jgi:hypothetical protein
MRTTQDADQLTMVNLPSWTRTYIKPRDSPAEQEAVDTEPASGFGGTGAGSSFGYDGRRGDASSSVNYAVGGYTGFARVPSIISTPAPGTTNPSGATSPTAPVPPNLLTAPNTTAGSVPSPAVPPQPLPHEERALNFLVNQYLRSQNFKMTCISFSDEVS